LRLTERLKAETAAFADGRPQDVAAGLSETQEMANLYRRDSAHVKANPALLSGAPSKIAGHWSTPRVSSTPS
jgi:hypothetical protein